MQKLSSLTFVFTTILLSLLIATTSNAMATQDGNSPLVGTWSWDMSEEYVYVFHADGTGTRGFANHVEDFTWQTTVQNNLGIITSTDTESWRYTVDGDVLTLDSLQVVGMTYSYIRDGGTDTRTPPSPVAQDENSPLIGIWGIYFDTSLVKYFNADGTGFWGFPDEEIHFIWTVDGNNLRTTYGTILESWAYEVVDDFLFLDSFQFWGEAHDFVKLDAFPETTSLERHPLVGVWHWDLFDYVRIFDGDGTGYSGFIGDLQPIRWRASDTNMHITSNEGLSLNWQYQINSDVLTLTSPYHLGLIYSYIIEGGEDTRTPPLPIVAPRNHPLIGTWRWEDGRNYGYAFNADGTGIMHSPDESTPFTWIIAGTGNLRITVDTVMYSWSYEIDDDTLLLQSILLAGREYVYVRSAT